MSCPPAGGSLEGGPPSSITVRPSTCLLSLRERPAKTCVSQGGRPLEGTPGPKERGGEGCAHVDAETRWCAGSGTRTQGTNCESQAAGARLPGRPPAGSHLRESFSGSASNAALDVLGAEHQPHVLCSSWNPQWSLGSHPPPPPLPAGTEAAAANGPTLLLFSGSSVFLKK